MKLNYRSFLNCKSDINRSDKSTDLLSKVKFMLCSVRFQIITSKYVFSSNLEHWSDKVSIQQKTEEKKLLVLQRKQLSNQNG